MKKLLPVLSAAVACVSAMLFSLVAWYTFFENTMALMAWTFGLAFLASAVVCVFVAARLVRIFPFRLSRMCWIGLTLFCLGSGPLLLTMAAAKYTGVNANPIFFGILAMFTFFPSIALMLGGTVKTVITHRRQSRGLR